MPQKYIAVSSKSGGVVYELNGSATAEALYSQLTITSEVERYGDTEKIFYPKNRLPIEAVPLANAHSGTLAYYGPWGAVVMFYGNTETANGLWELGKAVFGTENLPKLRGNVTVYRCNDKGQSL